MSVILKLGPIYTLKRMIYTHFSFQGLIGLDLKIFKDSKTGQESHIFTYFNNNN